MTTIESKEDISDNDSGIILHSGKNMKMKIKNTMKQHLNPAYVTHRITKHYIILYVMCNTNLLN